MKIKIYNKSEEQKKARNESHTRERNNSISRQLIAGCIANLTLINVGLHFGWPTVSLPYLEDEKSAIHVTSSEGAWIVSALSVGACLGPMISVLLVNRIGRKWTLLLTVIPSVGSWTLIYYAQNAGMFCIARFIGGIGLGSTFATIPMYVGEIADKKTRGALGCVIYIMISFGTILIYGLTLFVSISILALVAIVPSVIFMCAFVWMPETPYYYLTRKEHKEAERALIWLRQKRNVTLELQEMCILTGKEQRQKGGIKELVKADGNRWATLMLLVTFGAQQLSGFAALTAYSGLIIEGISCQMNPKILVGACGIISLIFYIVAFFIIDRIGRKPLILLSSIGVTLSLVLMAVYFHLRSKGTEDLNSMFWLPVISLMTFFAFFAIGLGPVPWAMVSEMYPINVKASATMLFSIYASILSFIICKLFQIVADQWGKHAIFYSFATIEAIFTFLIMIVVFETRGKSFQEIQARLQRKGSKGHISTNKVELFYVNSPKHRF